MQGGKWQLSGSLRMGTPVPVAQAQQERLGISCDPKGRLLALACIFYWDREQTTGHGATQTPLSLLAPLAAVPLCVGTAQVPPHPLQPIPSTSSQLSGTIRGQAGPSSASGASAPPSPALPSTARLRGPSLCALLQAGLGVWMEGGMLWGDRNPCSGKHIKRVTLYRGREGGAGRGHYLVPSSGLPSPSVFPSSSVF